MHTGHHPDIVVVEKVDLLEVEVSRELSFIISKEEFCYCLRYESLGFSIVDDTYIVTDYSLSINGQTLLAERH